MDTTRMDEKELKIEAKKIWSKIFKPFLPFDAYWVQVKFQIDTFNKMNPKERKQFMEAKRKIMGMTLFELEKLKR